MRIAVQVTPNAKKTEVIGPLDDALKIRLQAQPIEGRANDALIRYLAEKLGVTRSAIRITHGHTGKRKVLEVTDSALTVEMTQKALLESTRG